MSGEDRSDEPSVEGDDEDRDRAGDRAAEPAGTDVDEDGVEGEVRDASSVESSGSEPIDGEDVDAGRPSAEGPEQDEDVPTDESRVEELEAIIEDKEAEIDELSSRLKRVQADFQNYKKRMKKRREEERQRATEGLVGRLLDVRDNLSRALDEEHADVETLREGVKMTLAELDRVLDAEDVSRIEPDPGDEVDPRRHEVMMRVESDRPADAIDSVYAPGYEMGEKLLRPAQVTVSEGAGTDGAASDPAESGDESQ